MTTTGEENRRTARRVPEEVLAEGAFDLVERGSEVGVFGEGSRAMGGRNGTPTPTGMSVR